MPSEEESRAHPLPTSVIITNESTPLLSQEQHRIGSTIINPGLQNNKQPALYSFDVDTTIKKKEITGMILLSISSLLFAIISVLVKYLGEQSFHSSQIVFARSAMQLFMGLIGCLILRINPLGKKGIRKWILLRAVTSSLALCLFFYGLTKLPLIEATVLFFVGPIFKVVFGSGVLNEIFTMKDSIHSVGCFIGLLLVIKPSILFNKSISQDKVESLAILLVLTGALLSAMAYVTVRRLGQDTHVFVHMVYFGLVASLFSLTHLYEFRIPTSSNHVWMFLAIGMIAFLGQFLLNRGLKLAPFGLANVIQTGDVILAYVFGIVLFKEIPGTHTVFGSILVVFMTTSSNINRWRMYQKRNSELRRRRPKDRLIQQQREQH